MAHGALRTADKSGQVYTIERAPERTARVTRLGGGWAAVVALDAWCEGELAWWEGQLDAAAQGPEVWVLVDEQHSVVGHLSDARWGAAPGRAHAFLVDNAARRPLPALGERYVPPAAPARPKRTRGLAR